MKTYVSIAYIYLDPDVDNPCQDFTHNSFVGRLNQHFPAWQDFHKACPDLNLGLVVGMNLGIENLVVKGPTKFKGMKTIDYSIFLPTWVRELDCSNPKDIETYIKLFLQGLELCLKKYNVPASEFAELHSELLLDLVASSSHIPS